MNVIKKFTKEVEVVIDTLCDKCNKSVQTESYDAFRFDFEVKTGTEYLECGSGEKSTLDLCPTCAEALLALLKENNYRVQTKEWDC